MELYTFLSVVGVAVSDAYHASSAGVVVVAPEGGGDGEDREDAGANELGVQSVVEGGGGGEGAAAAVAAKKQAAADLKLVADLVATSIQVRVLKCFHCETQIFQTLNPQLGPPGQRHNVTPRSWSESTNERSAPQDVREPVRRRACI